MNQRLFVIFLLLAALTASKADKTCLSSTDCPNLYDCVNGICKHKSLFPLAGIEIGGLFVLVILTGLANAGGIGGGTLLTCILIIFFNYNENNSIAFVYALVFGGALGNFINVGGQKDKKTGKPLVNYELGLVCMPPMILGTNIGVILGRIVAPIIILIGIITVTLYSALRIFKKMKNQFKKESQENKDQRNESFQGHLLDHPGDEVHYEPRYSENLESEGSVKVSKIIEDEHKLFPMKKLGLIIALIAIIILLLLFRGTENFHSIIGIQYCGVLYWLLLVVQILVCLAVFFVNKRYLKSILETKRLYQISSSKGEFEMSEGHINKLAILSLVAGVLAGLLGIGGGMVMSPTLLTIGVPAMSLGATSGFFVVQTSFISLFQSILYGDVPIGDQAFFFGISLVGSFGVSFFLTWLVKKLQRPSIILIALFGVLMLSVITTPIFEIFNNLDNFGRMVKFNSIC